MRRRIVAVLALVVVGAACGEGGAVPTSPTSPPPSSTTTTLASTTTSVVATTSPPTTMATTTTSVSAPYHIETPSLGPPPVLPGSEGPSGSGCIPGSNTVVPDGVWFGFVLATSGTEVTFDMACWFWGELAESEAIKDGQEALNNYYIRNQNPLTFSVPIGSGATIYWLDTSSGNFVPEPMPMAAWPGPDEAWPCPGELCGVWLYINGGVITEAIEQYRP